LKVSIITVSYNSEKTIESTIVSVLNQNYNNIEYIIIDGGSNDNTFNIINNYKNYIDIYISESDNGIYDAINKGIKVSSGDIIGILNSDDVFASIGVISNVIEYLTANQDCDGVYGDVVFVNKNDKIKRYYSSKNWDLDKLKWGFMPAHPSFYCKKSCYQLTGLYSLDYKIASDFDLITRFVLNRYNFKYLNIIFVKMKLGGISTRGIKSTILINKEISESLIKNNINSNYFYFILKYIYKVFNL
jgi:glycosyltransferase involved in cell wall biosynthesis